MVFTEIKIKTNLIQFNFEINRLQKRASKTSQNILRFVAKLTLKLT